MTGWRDRMTDAVGAVVCAVALAAMWLGLAVAHVVDWVTRPLRRDP